MVVTCAIEFDNNPHGTYFAGQTLRGRFTLKTDELKEVRAVALKVRGFAFTQWTETHTGADNKSVTRTFGGCESYIASKTYLLGSNAGTQKQKIKPGIHNYSFACQIPLSCPSTFEGLFGHVRYTVKAVLEQPWKVDQSYTRVFTVLKMMDLNNYSSLLSLPVHTEIQKTFCCWPCGSKPMKFKLSLPQTGFVPGQEIPVGVLVTNDSSVPVEEITITLGMIVRYHCQNDSIHSKTERLVMAKLKGEGVLRQCTKSFVYPLRVPAMPPTCSTLSRLVRIAYQVELAAKLKGWHRDEYVHIPVTIGSVPLMNTSMLVQQQPTNSHRELLMVPPAAAQVPVIDPTAPVYHVDDGVSSSSLWSVDDIMPPPNYEEAINQPTIHKNSSEAGTSQRVR